MKALGIDVASSSWGSNGSATVEFSKTKLVRATPAAIDWPQKEPLTPRALAGAIDAFARREGVCAIGLDGPQGFRDPETAKDLPGVGRRCEYACRTQGKTGEYPQTYPKTQRGWIEFSVELFKELLAKPGVALAGSSSAAYVILEAFPTSIWRASGLVPLPAKQKKPELAPYAAALAKAYGMPKFRVASHDDLQAVPAALAAVGAAGGPVVAQPKGIESRVLESGLRVEGFIWDVKPSRVIS